MRFRFRAAALSIAPWLSLLAACALAESPQKPSPYDTAVEWFRVGKGGEILLLPVEFKGKSYRFLVDTGATRTVYDASLEPLLDGPHITREVETPDGTTTVAEYLSQAATLGGMSLRADGPVFVADLGGLRKVTGEEIRGILGMDFLGKQVLCIDPDRGVLAFLRAPGTDVGHPFPITWEGPYPEVEVTIGGWDKPVRFRIDTGCNGTGGLREELFEALVQQNRIRRVRNGLTTTLSGTAGGPAGRMESLTLGPFRHTDLPFGKSGWNLLGWNYLSRFVVTLDFPGNRIYLRKGAGYDRRDPGDRSGLALLRDGKRTVVLAVFEGSPAAAAGIKPRDEILTVEGEKAETMKLFAFRRLLCSQGKTVRLQINRDGKEWEASVALRDWHQER